MLLSNRSTVWPRKIPLSRGQSKSLLSKKSGRRRLRLKPLRPLSLEVGRPKAGFRRSVAEKRPTSTSRHPAGNQGEQKPQATRIPTRQIVRADATRPHERQSGTPKKGAPHEPAQKVIPMGVKFGMLDGNAVRFTNFEAWWLVDGAWRPISPGEVLSNAAVMREAQFKEVFPQVPILPRRAFQLAAEGAKNE